MSQQSVTQFVCDNCARRVFSMEIPTGWSSVTFLAQTQPILEDADVCDSCADAFISAMGKRKRIENGRHKEPALAAHNPVHPMNAGYSPFTKRPIVKDSNSE